MNPMIASNLRTCIAVIPEIFTLKIIIKKCVKKTKTSYSVKFFDNHSKCVSKRVNDRFVGDLFGDPGARVSGSEVSQKKDWRFCLDHGTQFLLRIIVNQLIIWPDKGKCKK